MEYILEFMISLLTIIISTLIIIYNYKNGELYSPIVILNFLFIIHYALPDLFLNYSLKNVFSPLNLQYSKEASIYYFIAFSIINCLNLFLKRSSKKLQITNKKLEWSKKKSIILMCLLFTIGYLSRIYIIDNNSYFQITRSGKQENIDNAGYAFIFTFEKLPLTCLLISTIIYIKSKIKKWRNISLFIFFSEIAYWLPTGRKEELISTIIFPFILIFIIDKNLISFKKTVISFAFILLLFPVTRYFRDAQGVAILSLSNLTFKEIVEELKNSSEAGLDLYKEAPNDNEKGGGAFTRLYLKQEIAAAIRITKNDGLWLGKSYEGLVFNIIPRFVWKNKPEISYGNEFGKLADLLTDDDNQTSVAATILGEGFLNLGWIGWLPLLLFLMIMNVLYHQISCSKNTYTFIFIYVSILKFYFNIGIEFTGLITSIYKLLPFYYLICKIIQK